VIVEVTIQLLSGLNSRRRFKAALSAYVNRMTGNNSSPDEASAHFHYQAVLAALMLGDFKTAEWIQSYIAAGDDYSRSMECDYYRDLAAAHIRTHGNLATAERLIRTAMNVQRSPVKYRADQLVLAKIHLKRGMPDKAYRECLTALLELVKHEALGDGDITYLRNAAFMTLPHAIAHGDRLIRNTCYDLIIREDPSWKRKLVAHFLRWSGKPGVKLMDRWTS
jgi:hypothetical protein